MSRQALAGRYGPAQKDGSKRPRTTAAPPDPRDFALAVMRDESQPMALRASMAKAALPYLHKRGEEQEKDAAPEREPMSSLEVARRIAHIFERAKMEEEKQAQEKAQGEENAQPLLPPLQGRVPSASGAGGVLHTPTPPGRSFHSRPPSPDGEGEPSPDIFPDPHPGYRWIR